VAIIVCMVVKIVLNSSLGRQLYRADDKFISDVFVRYKTMMCDEFFSFRCHLLSVTVIEL